MLLAGEVTVGYPAAVVLFTMWADKLYVCDGSTSDNPANAFKLLNFMLNGNVIRWILNSFDGSDNCTPVAPSNKMLGSPPKPVNDPENVGTFGGLDRLPLFRPSSSGVYPSTAT